MDAKWEKFDNILSDLWNFFIPPILNAIVILIVFPDIPKLIWGGIGYIIVKLRDTADLEAVSTSLPDILGELTKNSTLFSSISGGAVSAVISTIVTFAILIFVLHKVILITSKIFCGQIDLDEESLNTHPKIAEALIKLRGYLPEDKIYDSVHRSWGYARTVNDQQESLTIYRTRRSKIISEIESNRSFATYASAYFLLSAISIIFVHFAFTPLIALFVTIFLFFLFARRYVNSCLSLADLDIYTFLTLAHYNKSSKSTVEAKSTDTVEAKGTGSVEAKSTGTVEAKSTGTVEAKSSSLIEKPRFTDHIRLFEGNIISVILGLIKAVINRSNSVA